VEGASLLYCAYLGGDGFDEVTGIAVDSSGSAYVTGDTQSTNFPVVGGFQKSHGGSGGYDAFVVKLTPEFYTILYSTYLGGDALDRARGIAVDSSGCAYVTGYTTSTNFPVTNAFQAVGNLIPGQEDAFVAKIAASGSNLVYSTYLGGSMNIVDEGYAIALDPAGAAVVGGVTWCSDFPLTNAYQSTLKGGVDGFITKFSPAGTNLLFSTFLGGNAWDEIDALALDESGKVCVAGKTKSTDLPTQHPFQSTFQGAWDMYVSQLSADGSNLLYSTYLGGASNDYAHGIAVDSFGMIYVAGETQSTNFPLVNPVQSRYGGGLYDIVMAKLNPQTSNLLYSTYYGSNGNEYANAVAVDSLGATYVGGQSVGSAYPPGAHINRAGGDSNDAVVLKISGSMLTELTLHCTPASNVISWMAEEGGRYSLQYTRTLTPTQWVGTPGQTNLPGVPGTMSATDPDVTATTRFYRILATEL